ncbi:MAG: TonB-dependent receptor [Chloroherpetonaceae bacterium]|nr:TonB-dependent receptor [Chloroherpetonaceae bacterium]
MKRLYLFKLVLLLVLTSTSVMAQGVGEITGVVSDASDKEKLIGAQISLLDTKTGTVTNAQGRFYLRRVKTGDYIVIAKYVGYKPQTKNVTVTEDKSVTVDFELVPTAVQASEVIVTGTGAATEKKKLSAPVQSINAERLNNITVQSIDQLLQGQVAGVSVGFASGLPGTGSRIQSRGVKSVAANSTPVFYVDNVRVDAGDNFGVGTGGTVSSSLAQLITGEVDRVEVALGGSAATLYGTQAGNGVTQIFTKKGTPGTPTLKIVGTLGADNPETKFVQEDVTRNLLFQTGFFQQYTANLNGGAETFTYNFSAMSRNSTGFIVRNQARDELYNLAFAARAILSDKLEAEFSTSFIRNSFDRFNQGNNIFAPLGAMETGSQFRSRNLNSNGTDNPDSLLAIWMTPDYDENVNRIITSLTFNYNPYNWFSHRLTVGLDYNKRESRFLTPIEASIAFGSTVLGSIVRSDREFFQPIVNYSGSVSLPELDELSASINFGGEAFRQEVRVITGSGQNLAAGTQTFNQAGIVTGSEGVAALFFGGGFAELRGTLLKNIFFDGGIRLDVSSAFGKEVSVIPLFRGGVATVLSDFQFYPEDIKPYVPYFKLRAALGQSGNFPAPFLRDRTYAAPSFLGSAAITFAGAGNPDVKPEIINSLEFGLDLGLWEDRLEFNATYSTTSTIDGLFSVPNDPVTGFGLIQRNIGEVLNNVWEFSLSGSIYKDSDFELKGRLNFTLVENNIPDIGQIGGRPIPEFAVGGFAFSGLFIANQRSIGAIRANRLAQEADGTYRGRFIANQFNGAQSIPTRFGSVGFDAIIMKDLTISALLEYSWGNALVNTQQVLRIANGYLDALSTVPGFVSLTQNSVTNPSSFANYGSFFVEDARWVKLRDITIRYNEPFGMSGLNLAFAIRNPFIISTSATGVDPELNWARAGGALDLGATGGANLSAARQIRFTIGYNF